MRWIKIVIGIVAFLFAVYSAVMYFFADESKSFTVEKTLDYPIDKVFPQFNNFQNFTRWNNYFSGSKEMTVDYYIPYEGQGSSMSFFDKKNDRNGEMLIHYENPQKTLKIQLFEGNKSNPSLIDIKFIPVSKDRTKIIWYVHTPKQPLLKRSINFWTEDVFVENLDKSMVNLKNLLGNKVEKDQQLSTIRYDSIMIEKQERALLLGVNVSTANKKDALFKNIILNYNKVYNFIATDLGKTDDEFGFPVLVTNPNNFKDKEISYFFGIPLSKRVGISDNNFTFKTMNESQAYVLYYKGNYANRAAGMQKLLQKAKKDTMRSGEIQHVFLEAPSENQDVNIKMILPVYR